MHCGVSRVGENCFGITFLLPNRRNIVVLINTYELEYLKDGCVTATILRQMESHDISPLVINDEVLENLTASAVIAWQRSNRSLRKQVKKVEFNTTEQQRLLNHTLELLKWWMPKKNRDEFIGDTLEVAEGMRDEGWREPLVWLFVGKHVVSYRAAGAKSRFIGWLAKIAGVVCAWMMIK